MTSFLLQNRHVYDVSSLFRPILGPKSDPNVVYLRARNLAGRPEGQDDVYLRAGLRPAPAGGRQNFFLFFFIMIAAGCLPPRQGGPPPPVVNIYDVALRQSFPPLHRLRAFAGPR